MKNFEQQIQELSDKALSCSIAKMIKIRSEIPNSLVDEWRRKDTTEKITFMLQEWERRGHNGAAD